MAGGADSVVYDYIGAYLQELREQRGETTDNVGEAVGLSSGSIRNIENNKQGITVPTFVRICWFLNVDPVRVLADVLADNTAELKNV